MTSDTFLLNVETHQLTPALKRLCKAEPRSKTVRLEYGSGILTISFDRTSEEVSARGTWPGPVFVQRIWAKTFAERPATSAITVLRPSDEWLDTNGNRMRCSLESSGGGLGASATREEAVTAAHEVLASYGTSESDLSDLIEAANPEIMGLWNSGDGSLIDEIASVWTRLAVHGVEPSDIRRVIDRNSKKLWQSRSREGGLFARYNVGEDDQRALVECGDSMKSQLCFRNSRKLATVAQAWKHLVLYGVEPFEILRLVERKSSTGVSTRTRADSR
jgi:hypothetical protein